MIDQAFRRAAEQIHGYMLPELKQLISDMLHNNIIQQLGPEEFQIRCIKFALEALALAALIWIGSLIRNGSKKNNTQKQKPKKKTRKQPQQTWTPTGWYWDEKKREWIPPDFLNQESQERWKWDKKKKIWIDLKKDE